MKIGMIGNFSVPYSTEADRKWSFEKLGHTVITFQENRTNQVEILEAINELDLLIYSHTHGWNIDGLKQVFAVYKANGVPTASVHLDRWAWLDRVKNVGQEATWFTEHIFMADGSPEAVELYERYKLNWHYLPPAVVERDCKVSEQKKYPPIVFTGTKNYHKEYPFRKHMVEFLQNIYGELFAHYGNDGQAVRRGDNLNALYSGAKIVIGDSCFGGRPRYVSDRYYEVRGRGGFLLHPHIEGIETHGVAPYKSQNLVDLKRQIDYWLTHDEEREAMRIKGFEWVKNNETYTQRAEAILKKVGLDEPH